MYYAYITKIQDIRPHSNADRLQVATILNSSVVVGLDYRVDDTVCYFPSDGQLSKEFAEVNKLTRALGGYFEENCKVRIQKFRGELSDGFACTLDLLEKFAPGSTNGLATGDRINTLNGLLLCKKFETEATQRVRSNKQRKQKTSRGSTITFPKHRDTEQLIHSIGSLQRGDTLVITSKCHGTSHRLGYVNTKVDLPKWKRFVNKIAPIFPTHKYQLMSGSRNVILENTDDRLPNLRLRNSVTNYFKDKLNKNELVFIEIVGYDGDKPIMPPHDAKKLHKDFLDTKLWGTDKVIYDYGCKPGNYEIYVYRIATINDDGDIVDYTHDQVIRRAEEMGLKTPYLYDKFIYDGDEESLLELVNNYSHRKDPIGNHWQEGVCIRVDSSNWKCFKDKNYYFKIMEGIAKDQSNYVDTEEAS